ncbi:MAG: Com family DNA-binding transcriptional regulator [Rhodospirillaceae bacterium]
MESIRCACGRKLAEGDFIGQVSIKCPRCRAINHIQRAARPITPERPGATILEAPFGHSQTASSADPRHYPPPGQ